MAVRAHDRQIGERRRALASGDRVCVVALDEAVAKLAIALREIDVADLAGKAFRAALDVGLLPPHERRITLGDTMLPKHEPPLDRAFLVLLRRQQFDLAVSSCLDPCD